MKTYQKAGLATALAIATVAAATATLAGPATPARPGRALSAAPVADLSTSPTVGKIFFSVNGKQHECTGNVVKSHNRDTISTAGSCLYFREKLSDQGTYVDLSFVPGYQNGERPYGTWTARNLSVIESWQQPQPEGISTNDVGFAVLNTLNGQHIQDVVGGTDIKFNKDFPNDFVVTGYDQGQTAPTSCRGNQDATFYPQISCSLGDGGQGAPWFVDGVQVSSTLGNQNGTSYGSAWHDEVKGSYDYAQYR